MLPRVPDGEGEAIGWHLPQALRLKNIQWNVKSKLSESNVE